MRMLRLCSRCNNDYIGHDSTSFDGMYFCPECMPFVRPGDYDPRPGETVRLIDGNQGRRWVVLTRDGEHAVIRQLGMPDNPLLETTVHNLWKAP